MKPNKMPVKEEKSGEMKKLKNRIRRLEKQNAQLKSELKTYDKYFEKTQTFVNDKTKDFTVVELIEAAKNKKSLKELQTEKIDKSMEVHGSVCNSCFSKNVQEDELPFGTLTICKDCGHTSVARK